MDQNLFDFSQVVQEAKDAVEKANQSSEYKYKLLYPGYGDLTVRLLYNPKSKLVTRRVARHQIGGQRVACLETWGQECPICKVLEDAAAVSGREIPYQLKRDNRNISFVQFISANYKLDPAPNPGEVCILMYPYTVYTGIQKFIDMAASSPTGMQMVFSMAKGDPLVISRDNTNKYSVMPNSYLATDFGMSDEEFQKMLTELDDLRDQVLPSEPTAEVMGSVLKSVTGLQSQFMMAPSPNINNYPVTQLAPPVSLSQAPVVQTPPQVSMPVVQSAPQISTPVATGSVSNVASQSQPTTNAGHPDCYGKYDSNAMLCQMCPSSLTCLDESAPF